MCDTTGECYPEGVIATNAIKVLDEKLLMPDTPFFHAVGFKRPHLSYRAPSEFFAMYALDDIALPVHPLPSPTAPAISYSHSCMASTNSSEVKPHRKGCNLMNYTRHSGDGQGPAGVEYGLIEINKDEQAVRELRKAYYATITFMDSQLGRVLDHLAASPLSDSTIITFIGDHGMYVTMYGSAVCARALRVLSLRDCAALHCTALHCVCGVLWYGMVCLMRYTSETG